MCRYVCMHWFCTKCSACKYVCIFQIGIYNLKSLHLTIHTCITTYIHMHIYSSNQFEQCSKLQRKRLLILGAMDIHTYYLFVLKSRLHMYIHKYIHSYICTYIHMYECLYFHTYECIHK